MRQIEKPIPQASENAVPKPENNAPIKAVENTITQQTTDKLLTLDGKPREQQKDTSRTQRKNNLNTIVNKAKTPPSTPENKQARKKTKPQPVAVRGRKPLRGQNKFYDRNNPEYKTLQKANHALAKFPVDTEGQVNWVLALENGMINPRTTRRGRSPMEILGTEIIMKNTRGMAHVRFPHKQHTEWLTCRNCHDKIFIQKDGENNINMTKIFRGEYCGVCHDKVAFSSFVCERCHSIPITVEQQ